MAAVTRQAHEHGVLVIWDLAHSVGALPIDLTAAAADFAVGCTYKYLNGGPGSPAFAWVHRRHQDRFWSPLSGWWGHARPFAMEPGFEPVAGINRFLCGTQPMVSLSLVACGLDIARRADSREVRRKSLALSDLFIELVEQRCGAHPLTLVTPRQHSRRGSHVSFAHPDGFAVMQALIARGVIGDYREPHLLRFGLTPLYLGYVEIWDAVETLRDILDTASWDDDRYRARTAVT
jgi:kynureninase